MVEHGYYFGRAMPLIRFVLNFPVNHRNLILVDIEYIGREIAHPKNTTQ